MGMCDKHGKYDAFVEVLGRKIPQPHCPRCVDEKIKEKEKKEKEAEQRAWIYKLRAASGVPPRYKDKRISDIDENPSTQQALRWIRRYLEVLPERLSVGASGSFCGDCGTGKTLIGCVMVNEIVELAHSARYTTAWQMIQDIRKAYTHKDISVSGQIQSFISPRFLVIDEIGVQSGTNDERVLLYQVIDGRYSAMKSTILISNLNSPVEDGFLDARTVDRLRENGGFNLVLSGESYRAKS